MDVSTIVFSAHSPGKPAGDDGMEMEDIQSKLEVLTANYYCVRFPQPEQRECLLKDPAEIPFSSPGSQKEAQGKSSIQDKAPAKPRSGDTRSGSSPKVTELDTTTLNQGCSEASCLGWRYGGNADSTGLTPTEQQWPEPTGQTVRREEEKGGQRKGPRTPP